MKGVLLAHFAIFMLVGREFYCKAVASAGLLRSNTSNTGGIFEETIVDTNPGLWTCFKFGGSVHSTFGFSIVSPRQFLLLVYHY